MTTERHSIWSITINNPTSADEEEIARARQKGWKVEGQLEKGENGTAHYQLMVSTGQVRFSAVKKAFTRAHIEPARNPQALKQYVEKEDTRIGKLATANEFYPSLSKFWIMVSDYCLTYEKDRLDVTYFDDHGIIRMYRSERFPTEQEWLRLLRDAISHMIYDGYHVEHFYSPPNISIFKNFASSIIHRSVAEKAAQTARQTDDTISIDSDAYVRSIATAEIPHINIPTNVDEEEVVSEEARQSPQADSPNSASLQESP